MASLTSAMACIGLGSTLYTLYCLFLVLYDYFVRPTSISRYLSTDPAHPSWALVTGSSDGIGLGFAHELCSRGFNVLLHGRNPEKLSRVRAELLQQFPARSVEIAVADAAVYDDTGIREVIAKASNLPNGGRLRVLVNNVGGANQVIGKGIFCLLKDTTGDEVDTLINVNARFPARLTVALFPVLMAQVNTPSLVINLGSMAGTYMQPYMTVYSATKSFNLSFSTSMGKELKSQGCDVEVLGFVVGTVDTGGAPAGKQGGLAVTTPRRLAKACLDRSGCGRWMLEPMFSHWMVSRLIDLIPEGTVVGKMKTLWAEEKKGE
jgi:short-subunit dehydrogenase